MSEGGARRSLLPRSASRGSGRAHRVFHPLCGATLPVLARTLLRPGAVSPGRAHVALIALGMGVLRLPFTLAEAAFASAAIPKPGTYPSPVFIVGHWRSGTTHLANLLSRSGAFGFLSPMAVGLPAEALGLGRVVRPFVEQFFPKHRLIDEIALASDMPQEDELAMANLSTLSCQHGVYAPDRLIEEFDRGLFGTGVGAAEHARWAWMLERYVAKMTWSAGGKPLLIRNPASSTRIAAIRSIWPDARFIHIHRDPRAVFGSSVAMFATLLRELAIGRADGADPRALVRHVYPRLVTSVLDAAEALPAGAFVSVAHAALSRHPLETVAMVADAIGLDRGMEGTAAMADYAAAHRRAPRIHALTDADHRFLDRHGDLVRRLGYGEDMRPEPAPKPEPASFPSPLAIAS